MSGRRLLVAFVAGAAMVPAFAPLEWFPLALAALAVLVHLWLGAPGPRAAAWLGFAFGMGKFLAGVSWVYISLHRYGAMPASLAAVATLEKKQPKNPLTYNVNGRGLSREAGQQERAGELRARQ